MAQASASPGSSAIDPGAGTSSRGVRMHPVAGLPLVAPGDDLAGLLIAALETAGPAPQAGDVLVLAEKIAAKAEGRAVDLASVRPSRRARELALAVDKEPRLVEVILSQSEEVLRYRRGVLVVVHKLGYVMANAGIDASNVDGGTGHVLLLPEDPDGCCAALRARLEAHFGLMLGVVMNDSTGRAWRNGVVGMALGAAGVPALVSLVGRSDLYGRPLQVTEVGLADGIAAAASLVMGEADEGVPAVLVRGLDWSPGDGGARTLIRRKSEDLFR